MNISVELRQQCEGGAYVVGTAEAGTRIVLEDPSENSVTEFLATINTSFNSKSKVSDVTSPDSFFDVFFDIHMTDDDDFETGWTRVTVHIGSTGTGNYSLSDVDDEVVVAIDSGGDLEFNITVGRWTLEEDKYTWEGLILLGKINGTNKTGIWGSFFGSSIWDTKNGQGIWNGFLGSGLFTNTGETNVWGANLNSSIWGNDLNSSIWGNRMSSGIWSKSTGSGIWGGGLGGGIWGKGSGSGIWGMLSGLGIWGESTGDGIWGSLLGSGIWGGSTGGGVWGSGIGGGV
jgi:hypothetical protein